MNNVAEKIISDDLRKLRNQHEELAKLSLDGFNIFNRKVCIIDSWLAKLSFIFIVLLCSNIGLWTYLLWGRG